MKPAMLQPANRLALRALLAVVVCAVWPGASEGLRAAASTNRLPAQGSTDRFLLILDTSSAMERNAENTQKAVTQLFSSGMVGQARPGDTIGLWTFNDELQTGVFPLQRWTPQNRPKIISTATEFMAKVRYEKKSRFDKVVEPLTSVVQDSERITVIILTDGTGKISGTPFDKEINESYRLNYAGQRKQRMPFLTVLRAKGGEFIDWRVNTPPFRPEFPSFPIEPKPAEPQLGVTETQPKPPSEPKPVTKPEPKSESQAPTVPPLIVAGEPAPTAPTTPTDAPITEPFVPHVTQTPPKPATSPLTPEVSPPDRSDAIAQTPSPSKPVETARSETPPTVTPSPAPPPPVAPQDAPDSPTTQDLPAESKPTEQPEPLSASPAEVPMLHTAVATPGESLFNRTNLMIAGGVLLVGAFVVFYLLMRRAARPEEKVSLITRSMDRDHEEP
jgi:hypothetical protein